jgi:hypothetical protein
MLLTYSTEHSELDDFYFPNETNQNSYMQAKENLHLS